MQTVQLHELPLTCLIKLLNWIRFSDFLIWKGRLFQTFGPYTFKLFAPKVTWFHSGVSRFNLYCSLTNPLFFKACSWFAPDLEILLIYRLKFNLSSKWIPKSSTAWNLSGLIIVSFFVNQSAAMLLSDANVSINLGGLFLPRKIGFYHQQSYV